MKTKYPRQPERFAKRSEKMQHLGTQAKIPILLVINCRLVLKDYYGSDFKVAMRILWEWFYLGSHSLYWSVLIWISDRVGWTKLRHIPDNPVTVEHWERHGYKCDHLNCQDDQCIDKSLPRWFKWVTRWHSNN